MASIFVLGLVGASTGIGELVLWKTSPRVLLWLAHLLELAISLIMVCTASTTKLIFRKLYERVVTCRDLKGYLGRKEYAGC